MSALYRKSEVLFAVLWIVVYVVLFSLADQVSGVVGVQKSVTLAVGVLLTTILVVWMKNNSLFVKYGLCKSALKPKQVLYYLPLVFLASVNVWFGVAWNFSLIETVFYILSMLLVGFLEEIIFRGLLFKAMCKDGIKSAVIVSSVTFGIGHLVNLVNGSSADLRSNLLQVVSAIAIGFLFTVLFWKSGSLLACIVTHGVLNGLSAVADQSAMTPVRECVITSVMMVVALVYAWYVIRKCYDNIDSTEVPEFDKKENCE